MGLVAVHLEGRLTATIDMARAAQLLMESEGIPFWADL
jgi:hypothetical protein